MLNLANKTIIEYLEEIQNIQSLHTTKLNTIQASLNALNISGVEALLNTVNNKLSPVQFKGLLGDSLTSNTGEKQVRQVSGVYDFSSFLPFSSLGSHPVLLWLSKEFQCLLNFRVDRGDY